MDAVNTTDANNGIWQSRIAERLLYLVLTHRLFIATVLVPTLSAVIYYGCIASDVYISESKFVVRSPERQAPTGLGALLQGTGFSRSQDDAYSVHDYILSRDALATLQQTINLKKAYGNSSIDRISRFAGLDLDDSTESLHRYYAKMVGIDIDSTSSISTLTVHAYTSADAAQINEQLLEMSEALVNKMNERARNDMIGFAQSETENAEHNALKAALALSAYRDSHGIFDTDKQSALQLQQVSKLQDEEVAVSTQLNQVRALAPSNPQIGVLENQLNTLHQAISRQTAAVAGDQHSLSSQSTEYEHLQLNVSFAEKELASAMASLEEARNEAQRKQLYLERIAQPSKPDMALEPRRLRSIVATFIMGLIAWGIIALLTGAVREHQD